MENDESIDLVEVPIETEEIDLSDIELDSDLETVTLNLDSNCRIVAKGNSTPCFTGGDNDVRYDESMASRPLQFNEEDELAGHTSCEDMDFSDDDDAGSFDPLEINKLGLDGVNASTSGNDVSSASWFNNSQGLFKEEDLTDSEPMSGDEEEGEDMKKLILKYDQKLPSGVTIAGLVTAVKDVVDTATQKLSSLNVAHTFSNAIFLKKKSSLDPSESVESPLMTCMEFMTAEASDGEGTDVDNLSGDEATETVQGTNELDLADLSIPNPLEDDALRYRGKDGLSVLQNDARRPSWTIEYFSDDEAQQPRTRGESRNRPKKERPRKFSRSDKVFDEALTDEEMIHVNGKEWTETDDSGNVTQITQIKTETSIKLEGDGEGLGDGDSLGNTTTTTTTRVVTTVTTEGGEEEPSDDLRHSVEVILDQFMGGTQQEEED